jgi:hypothetical protein
LGQFLGTIAGLITAFAITFIVLTFGLSIPEDVVHSAIVNDFLNWPDLELKFTVVATVLYPTNLSGVTLGTYVGYGATGSTVLMFLAWGTGGLFAGLLSRDLIQGIIAAIFSVVLGAFLSWLLIFFVVSGIVAEIFGGVSMLLLQVTLEGALYPVLAAVVGGILGGGISRRR